MANEKNTLGRRLYELSFSILSCTCISFCMILFTTLNTFVLLFVGGKKSSCLLQHHQQFVVRFNSKQFVTTSSIFSASNEQQVDRKRAVSSQQHRRNDVETTTKTEQKTVRMERGSRRRNWTQWSCCKSARTLEKLDACH